MSDGVRNVSISVMKVSARCIMVIGCEEGERWFKEAWIKNYDTSVVKTLKTPKLRWFRRVREVKEGQVIPKG